MLNDDGKGEDEDNPNNITNARHVKILRRRAEVSDDECGAGLRENPMTIMCCT
jgi:hypothetical protein